MMAEDASGNDESAGVSHSEVTKTVQEIYKLLASSNNLANSIRDAVKAEVLKLERFCINLSLRLAEKELMTTCTRNPPMSNSTSYAEAASGKPTTPPLVAPIKTKHVLRVFPKQSGDSQSDQQVSSESTKQILMTKVPLKGLNVGARVKRVSRGGVLVECRSDDEVRALSNAIQEANAGLEVKESKKVNPTFTMLLTGKDHDLDEVRKDILEKNEFLPKDPNHFKFVHDWSTKGGNTVVTLEVSPAAYHGIASQGFMVFQGWTRLRLRERDPVSQCFKCQRYGHKASDCRYKVNGHSASRCARCGDDHEDKEHCQSTPNCSNCRDYNVFAAKQKMELFDPCHTARDKSCPCRLKAFTKARQQNINYGF